MGVTQVCVAVVDDDASVRNALRRLLTTANFHTKVFSSGREFLASMGEWQPHCLIVDLKMPDMNGHELLKEVSGRVANLPVIIMTAFDQPESRGDNASVGAIAYLLKPIQEQDLFAAIAAALKIMDSDLDDVVYGPALDQSPIERRAPRGS